MRKRNNIFQKSFLYVLFIGLLAAPLVQKKLDFFKVMPLGGSYNLKENPRLTINNWLNGKYQNRKEVYLNESFGFRNWFIRLHNQIEYTFFNQTQSNGVIVGKHNYLYQKAYIDAYYGEDFIGKAKIESRVAKIKRVSELLHAKNIDLVIVIVPGKASFYHEYIPRSFVENHLKTTNYKVYCNEIEKTKLHFIDFQKWFLKMKNTSPYPLYPKTGIHWSSYGELIAADSLIKYIGVLRNIKTPQIKINTIAVKDVMQDRDDDIEESMNLMVNIPDLKMAYPSFDITTDSLTVKPKVLVVADSFYWGLFNWGISHRVFDHSQFWFYNSSIYSNDFKGAKSKDEVNILDEVKKNDVIVLMTTDANLPDFPFGFIDDLSNAYDLSNRTNDSKREKVIQGFIRAIKNTPEWLKMIKKQAIDQNVDLKTAIRNNAEFMVK